MSTENNDLPERVKDFLKFLPAEDTSPAAEMQKSIPRSMKEYNEREFRLKPPAVAPAHVWQLVKQLEESAPEANNRLGEMVATLLINYGPYNRGRHPVLIEADDQPVAMLVKVLTYYVERLKQIEDIAGVKEWNP